MQHAQHVASASSAFARKFNGEDLSRLAGLWHDLGKFQHAWQCYLRRETGFDDGFPCMGAPGHPNHSTAGAVLACQRIGKAGRVLAYLIAGHHTGLYDWGSGEMGEQRDLSYRLQQPDAQKELDDSLAAGIPDEILLPDAPAPDLRNIPGGKQGFSLWVRMLFSCLVDADFLDTEGYMNPDKAAARGGWPTLLELKHRFDVFMEEKARTAKQTTVNKLRTDILAQCRAKANRPENLFTLTVPTGGGKTLSSMAFAVRRPSAWHEYSGQYRTWPAAVRLKARVS